MTPGTALTAGASVRRWLLGGLLGLSATLCLPALEQPAAAPAKPITAERAVVATLSARVTAIDHAARRITLAGPLGNVTTFVVGERVEHLDQIAVGDEVTVEYYVSLAGEVREPTESEKTNPLVVFAAGAMAIEGQPAAAAGVRVFKAVGTVIGLDLPSQTLTLLGPLGNSGAIRVRSSETLKQLRLGDTVVIVYSEALVTSVRKLPSTR